VSGRRVRSLADGALPGGTLTSRWDGRDDAGDPLPSGVYLVRLMTRDATASSKIVLLR